MKSKIPDIDLSAPFKGKSYAAIKGFKGETIPALFLERCSRTPSHIAYRVKEFGIYRAITWQECKEHVENFCLGLVELGLHKGDTVGLMGDPCVELSWGDVAVQCAGGIAFGIYSTCAVPQVKYHLADAGASFLVVEDQEFVDKVLALGDEVPNLKRIIVVDTRAIFAYIDPRLISFKEVEEIGAKVKEQRPSFFEEMVSQVQPGDIASLCYTSGTGGEFKGAISTHSNWVRGIFSFFLNSPVLLVEGTRFVANMPMGHIVGRELATQMPIVGGYTVFFGESPETLQETIFEVSPEYLLGTPRFFEKLAAQVIMDIGNSSWIKKAVYRAAMAIGRRYITNRWEGKHSVFLSLLYRFAYQVAFRPILDKLGFMNLKIAAIGAAPVASGIVALWQTWGLDMREFYGATEISSGAIQLEEFPRPGDSGPVAPAAELRVLETGEAIIKGNAFSGYWKKEEATAQVFKDGWVYTGDLVEVFEDGRIKIVDRVKDVIVTSGGKTIAPSEAEKALRASPYISEAIYMGHGRKYPTALIEINFDTVSNWARQNGVLYTSFASLAAHPGVYELIGKEVEKANEQLSSPEQVKRFSIMPKELDPEEITDPVTPTRKVQRQKMYERYRDLVESMYSKAEEERILAEVGGIVKG